MMTITLNQVLELTRKLPGDEQDMLVDLVRKSRAEQWRKQLARDAHKAERDYRAGKLKAEPVEALIARLHRSLDEPDS